MAYEVVLTDRAQDEQDAIFDYLAQRSPSGARNVVAAMERAFTMLGEHPEAGAKTRMRGVRAFALGNYPYRIFYRTHERIV